MEILGYVGFSILVFLGVAWTIGVRQVLSAGIGVILSALFFLVAALVIGISGANKLHSFWIIPLGYLLSVIVILLIDFPLIFKPLRILASVFAAIVRVGISQDRIEAAQPRFEEYAKKIKRNEINYD